MTDEVWLPFGNIEVSNMGRIKTLRKGIHFGYDNGRGYRVVGVDGKMARVHRLVAHLWLGLDLTDTNAHVNHINCDKSDNRVGNLELVNHRENHQRTKKHLEGKLVGCTFLEKRGKWKAQIHINGKDFHLGYFGSELEASKAYYDALVVYGIQEST